MSKVCRFPERTEGRTIPAPEHWMVRVHGERLALDTRATTNMVVLVLDEVTQEGVQKVFDGWPGVKATIAVLTVDNVVGYQWILIDDRIPAPDDMDEFDRDVELIQPGIKTVLVSMEDVGRLVDPSLNFVEDVNQAFMGELVPVQPDFPDAS